MIQPGDEPIPGYRLERLLGRGQYGEVWRAITPGRSSVALKFLDLTGKQGRKEFRSAQRVKQIRHAHLMPIVAIWFLDKDGQVLNDEAMESLSEEETASMKTLAISAAAPQAPAPARMIIATPLGDMTLRDRMAEAQTEGMEGIPVAELVGYMQEAAKGIDYLNSEQHDWRGSHVGVQHCDIKPDNIMLVGGSVVICDFGVAQVLADYGGGVRATSLSGSPAYMSPEAFDAKPCRTSDQYSLAVTYYELRTGQLPLHAETFAAVYEAHRSGKLDFSLVPKEEQAVLRRATNPDPERRFNSSGEFVQALRAVTIGEVAPSKTSKWVSLAAGVIAVALCVVAFSLWQWQAKTFKVTLHFDLPSAKVRVNNKPYTADPSGALEVKATVNTPLSIAAKGNEDRTDAQWSITAAELRDKKSFDFAIPFTAEHHAVEGEKLLAAGKVDDAVEALAIAIKAEPDKYARLPEPAVVEIPGFKFGDSFQVTPKGDVLIAGGKDDGAVRSWKISKVGLQSKSEELYRHEEAIANVVVTDELVASACENGAIWVHRDGRAEQLEVGDGAETDLAITGDGKFLVAAVATPDLTTKVYAWELSSRSLKDVRKEIGEQKGDFPRLVGTVGDSVVLATKDLESLVSRWNVTADSFSELGGQQNTLWSLTASADGRRVAYAGDMNSDDIKTPEAAIVDVENGVSFPCSAQSGSIYACVLGEKGSVLVTAESISSATDSGVISIWRPDLGSRSATMDRVLAFDRKLGDVHALALSPDGQWLAAGHDRGAVSLWQMSEEQSKPLLIYGSGDRVLAVRVTPDGRWLISGGSDGRTMVFDLRRLEAIFRACEKVGVTPKVGEDQVTLQGPDLKYFPFGSVIGEAALAAIKTVLVEAVRYPAEVARRQDRRCECSSNQAPSRLPIHLRGQVLVLLRELREPGFVRLFVPAEDALDELRLGTIRPEGENTNQALSGLLSVDELFFHTPVPAVDACEHPVGPLGDLGLAR